jgi:N-acetylneuraminate synthase
MNIAGREIGPDHPPYIVAEISCNHGGSLDRALNLIEAAKECGADAVKFQCYTADTITIDSDRPEFIIQDGPWKGRNLYQLYKTTQTPPIWFNEIKKRADQVGITWFASVFDPGAVEILECLDCPAYKIASFELVDLPLIEYAAATGKPLILSTGMATMPEILNAVEAIGPAAAHTHGLLHCVSAYPTKRSDANLGRIVDIQGRFSYFDIGISDHTSGCHDIPIAATALGACIIEKHFLGGYRGAEDEAFSLDEEEFAIMCLQVRSTWAALQPTTSGSEEAHLSLRRSLFAVADIKAGEEFTAENVRSIRPGHGLPPAAIGEIIGRRALRDIARGEPMAWDMV